MDLLRSCYVSNQRMCGDDSTILTPGSWRWCLPGAKVLPIPHSFGSSNWDDYRVRQDYPLGEQRGRHRYNKGKPDPRQLGDHYCGTPEAWLNGIPAAARPGLELGPEGIPICCIPANQQRTQAPWLVISAEARRIRSTVAELRVSGRTTEGGLSRADLVVSGSSRPAAIVDADLVVSGSSRPAAIVDADLVVSGSSRPAAVVDADLVVDGFAGLPPPPPLPAIAVPASIVDAAAGSDVGAD